MPAEGDDVLRHAIARAVGVATADVGRPRPAAGGDVSRAHAAVVDGRPAFVKTVDPPVPGLLAAEAAGLRWLGEAAEAGGLVAVPEVLGVHDPAPTDSSHPGADAADVRVLVIAHVEQGPPATDHDERLGRGLAGVHRAGAPTFGASWPGFLGRVPLPVDPAPDAAAALGARLDAAAVAADARGALPPGTRAALDALRARLPELLGPPEPPARLHGDLWAGNAIVDAAGHPVLIDPAAHGGHREADLAMMRLFGGFGPAAFAAYDEAHPLAPGHDERVALHQLLPLLVHAAMFGGGWGRRARDVVERYR